MCMGCSPGVLPCGCTITQLSVQVSKKEESTNHQTAGSPGILVGEEKSHTEKSMALALWAWVKHFNNLWPSCSWLGQVTIGSSPLSVSRVIKQFIAPSL